MTRERYDDCDTEESDPAVYGLLTMSDLARLADRYATWPALAERRAAAGKEAGA
jgi:hypothetical protein